MQILLRGLDAIGLSLCSSKAGVGSDGDIPDRRGDAYVHRTYLRALAGVIDECGSDSDAV